MQIVGILIAVYLLGSGLWQVLKPGRRLRAEEARLAKALANSGNPASPPVCSPDQAARRLRRIRLGGVVRLAVVAAALTLWAGGASLGWQHGSEVSALEGEHADERTIVEGAGREFLREGRASGLVVGAISGTNHLLLAFGTTGVCGGKVTGETLWEIGSITKVFTGVALASEVESGRLELDQPLRSLLPAEVPLPPGGEQITLGHLTSHTSGLPRLPQNMSALGLAKMVFVGGNPYASYSESDFCEGLRLAKLHCKPGERPEYSNFGTGLLGWVLAKRNGVTYEEYIRRIVCEPLGMESTRIALGSTGQANLAQGYRWIRKFGPFIVALRSRPWTLPNPFAGAGGLRSTGGDMLRFLNANMHPEGWPIAGALRKAQEERVREDEKTAIGMNWIRSRYAWCECPVIWHNGGTGGYRSYLGFTEDGRAGVVVLSNSAQGVDELGLRILQQLHEKAPEGDPLNSSDPPNGQPEPEPVN